MKKTLFFFALAMLLLSATRLQAQLGFHAGYAPQNFTVSGLPAGAENTLPSLSHGFFGGVHYNFAIVDKLGFSAALQIRLNSATVNTEEEITQDWQFLADLPLLLKYGFSLGHDMSIGVFAGPMLSYGISYTQKTTDAETYEVIVSRDRYGTSDPEYAMKRFEVGGAGGLFFKFRSFMLFGGYRLGFNDIDRRSDCSTKPRGFIVGLGIN